MDRLAYMSRKKSELDSRDGREMWASRVKDLRIASGMRQEDVAKLAAVSRTTLIDIEAGKLVPQAGTLTRILDVFSVAPDTTPGYSEDTQRWLAILGELLDVLNGERRARAGQAAVSAVTAELTRDVPGTLDDDYGYEPNPPKKGDLDLAAKRGHRK